MQISYEKDELLSFNVLWFEKFLFGGVFPDRFLFCWVGFILVLLTNGSFRLQCMIGSPRLYRPAFTPRDPTTWWRHYLRQLVWFPRRLIVKKKNAQRQRNKQLNKQKKHSPDRPSQVNGSHRIGFLHAMSRNTSRNLARIRANQRDLARGEYSKRRLVIRMVVGGMAWVHIT